MQFLDCVVTILLQIHPVELLNLLHRNSGNPCRCQPRPNLLLINPDHQLEGCRLESILAPGKALTLCQSASLPLRGDTPRPRDCVAARSRTTPAELDSELLYGHTVLWPCQAGERKTGERLVLQILGKATHTLRAPTF